MRPVSVEHKLGIHASPTCVIAFGDHGGAEGHLIGRENEGLAAMFTMMNYMRLGVGLQAVGVSERCYQQSAAYARERVQGRAPGVKGRVPIIRHPDVRRMLLTMRSLTQAARALVLLHRVLSRPRAHGTDAEVADAWQARADLLTPIAKAWCTEVCAGNHLARHPGARRHGLRRGDRCRAVLPRHADRLDLRRHERHTGHRPRRAQAPARRRHIRLRLVSEMRVVDPPLANAGEEFAGLRQALTRALDEVVQCSTHLLTGDKRDPDLAGAAAMNYLMLMGTVIGGWQLARGALAATSGAARGMDAAFLKLQTVLARFYAEQILPRALVHAGAVRAGSATLMALPAEQF